MHIVFAVWSICSLLFMTVMCIHITILRNNPAVQKRSFKLLMLDVFRTGLTAFFFLMVGSDLITDLHKRVIISSIFFYTVVPVGTVRFLLTQVLSVLKNISFIELTTVNSLKQSRTKVNKPEILFLRILGLKGTTKRPLKEILRALICVFFVTVAFFVFLLWVCSDKDRKSRELLNLITLPMVSFLMFLNIWMFTQVCRTIQVKDSYHMKHEFLLNCILNVVSHSSIYVTIFLQKKGLFGFNDPRYSIKCLTVGIVSITNNLIIYGSILHAVYGKGSIVSLSIQSFTEAIDRGYLSCLKEQLASDFCMEYYNFLNDLDTMNPIELYETYVKEDSLQELNISPPAREIVVSNMSRLEKIHFQRVKKEVIMLIYTNSYSRYLNKTKK